MARFTIMMALLSLIIALAPPAMAATYSFEGHGRALVLDGRDLPQLAGPTRHVVFVRGATDLTIRHAVVSEIHIYPWTRVMADEATASSLAQENCSRLTISEASAIVPVTSITLSHVEAKSIVVRDDSANITRELVKGPSLFAVRPPVRIAMSDTSFSLGVRLWGLCFASIDIRRTTVGSYLTYLDQASLLRPREDSSDGDDPVGVTMDSIVMLPLGGGFGDYRRVIAWLSDLGDAPVTVRNVSSSMTTAAFMNPSDGHIAFVDSRLRLGCQHTFSGLRIDSADDRVTTMVLYHQATVDPLLRHGPADAAIDISIRGSTASSSTDTSNGEVVVFNAGALQPAATHDNFTVHVVVDNCTGGGLTVSAPIVNVTVHDVRTDGDIKVTARDSSSLLLDVTRMAPRDALQGLCIANAMAEASAAASTLQVQNAVRFEGVHVERCDGLDSLQGRQITSLNIAGSVFVGGLRLANLTLLHRWAIADSDLSLPAPGERVPSQFMLENFVLAYFSVGYDTARCTIVRTKMAVEFIMQNASFSSRSTSTRGSVHLRMQELSCPSSEGCSLVVKNVTVMSFQSITSWLTSNSIFRSVEFANVNDQTPGYFLWLSSNTGVSHSNPVISMSFESITSRGTIDVTGTAISLTVRNLSLLGSFKLTGNVTAAALAEATSLSTALGTMPHAQSLTGVYIGNLLTFTDILTSRIALDDAEVRVKLVLTRVVSHDLANIELSNVSFSLFHFGYRTDGRFHLVDCDLESLSSLVVRNATFTSGSSASSNWPAAIKMDRTIGGKSQPVAIVLHQVVFIAANERINAIVLSTGVHLNASITLADCTGTGHYAERALLAMTDNDASNGVIDLCVSNVHAPGHHITVVARTIRATVTNSSVLHMSYSARGARPELPNVDDIHQRAPAEYAWVRFNNVTLNGNIVIVNQIVDFIEWRSVRGLRQAGLHKLVFSPARRASDDDDTISSGYMYWTDVELPWMNIGYHAHRISFYDSDLSHLRRFVVDGLTANTSSLTSTSTLGVVRILNNLPPTGVFESVGDTPSSSSIDQSATSAPLQSVFSFRRLHFHNQYRFFGGIYIDAASSFNGTIEVADSSGSAATGHLPSRALHVAKSASNMVQLVVNNVNNMVVIAKSAMVNASVTDSRVIDVELEGQEFVAAVFANTTVVDSSPDGSAWYRLALLDVMPPVPYSTAEALGASSEATIVRVSQAMMLQRVILQTLRFANNTAFDPARQRIRDLQVRSSAILAPELRLEDFDVHQRLVIVTSETRAAADQPSSEPFGIALHRVATPYFGGIPFNKERVHVADSAFLHRVLSLSVTESTILYPPQAGSGSVSLFYCHLGNGSTIFLRNCTFSETPGRGRGVGIYDRASWVRSARNVSVSAVGPFGGAPAIPVAVVQSPPRSWCVQNADLAGTMSPVTLFPEAQRKTAPCTEPSVTGSSSLPSEQMGSEFQRPQQTNLSGMISLWRQRPSRCGLMTGDAAEPRAKTRTTSGTATPSQVYRSATPTVVAAASRTSSRTAAAIDRNASDTPMSTPPESPVTQTLHAPTNYHIEPQRPVTRSQTDEAEEGGGIAVSVSSSVSGSDKLARLRDALKDDGYTSRVVPVAVTASVTVAGVLTARLASPSAAGRVPAFGATLRTASCGTTLADEELSYVEHPIQFPVGSGPWAVPAGAALGSMLVVAGAGACHVVLLWLARGGWRRLATNGASPPAWLSGIVAQATAVGAVILLAYLGPGVASAGVGAAGWGSGEQSAAGAASLLVAASVAAGIFRLALVGLPAELDAVAQRVAARTAATAPADGGGGVTSSSDHRVLQEDVDKGQETGIDPFTAAAGPLYMPARDARRSWPSRVWFFEDLAFAVAQGALGGIDSGGGAACRTLLGLLAVVGASHCVFIAAARPYEARFDLAFAFANGVMVVFVAMAALARPGEAEDLLDVAAVAQTILFALQPVVAVVAEFLSNRYASSEVGDINVKHIDESPLLAVPQPAISVPLAGQHPQQQQRPPEGHRTSSGGSRDGRHDGGRGDVARRSSRSGSSSGGGGDAGQAGGGEEPSRAANPLLLRSSAQRAER